MNSDNVSNTHNGIGDSDGIVNANVTDKDNNVPRHLNDNNCFTYTVPANDIHARIVNNCVVYNVPNGEIIASDVGDSQVMEVGPASGSANPEDNTPVNGNTNDNFQTQGRKRNRDLSNEIISSKKLVTDHSIPLQNSFNVLANLPTDDAPSGSNDKTTPISAPKIQPIMMKRSIDYRDMLKQINEVEGIPCKAKEAGEFLKLFCQTPKDVRSLVNFLDKKGKEYFVIAERAEKPVKVVIKGLPIDTDLDHIKTELTNLKYRVDKVNQLKKYKTREPLRIFQVHLLPTENIKEIYNLKALGYTIINVEPYENKQSHQCFNCQLWNHGSKGCKLNPKCVVCAGDHASKECPNKGKSDVQVKCTNCNGPHTANYRGCPKYPKNIQRNGRVGLNKVQPGRSFAAAAKSHEVNKPTPLSARAPHPQFGENVSKQIPPPRAGRTDTRPSPTEVNDPFPFMGQSGLTEVMALAAEANKIFQGIKNVSETIKNMQATTDPWTKLMILAEAIRPNAVIP
ncbi:Nucleic-acid-binding protein from transposon X-element [Araneus ventricosus]|uniref:Nucleic-acid-binding protein from transposon X-element n=1 Tax=Araneus ventricosus TaxID=182803 RepID=A0A4Y2S1V1_ARAVE|nr:Nucleic-acid-binding protein from transposon X-element [Araneus ventricosus]